MPAIAPLRPIEGFTLVETLIALLVLSVGVLGGAQLLVRSLADTHSALLRSQALDLVADMAESIRADATAATADDLARWRAAARRALPVDDDAEFAVVRYRAPDTSSPLARFHVSLSWRERGQSAPASVATEIVLLPRSGTP